VRCIIRFHDVLAAVVQAIIAKQEAVPAVRKIGLVILKVETVVLCPNPRACFF
jgi:hypothetical protein